MSKNDTELRVRVGAEALSAVVEIGALCPSSAVTREAMVEAARASGVEVDDVVAAGLGRIAEAFRKKPGRMSEVFAEAAMPTAPTDPELLWDFSSDEDSGSGGSGAVDHRAQARFCSVSEGAVLGTVKAGTPGSPGRDVLGQALAPEPVRSAKELLDPETITVNAGGELVALRGGTLRESEGVYRIDDAIVIETDIDYTVGHVEAEGSLYVRGGVKDLFRIRMSKDVEVMGLVEEASVECGGSLTLRSGMAGRGKGTLEVGGDAQAAYLNGVEARVRGSVEVGREVVNCRLTVGGALMGKGASLIGGETVVTGAIELGVIGSPSETPTVLHLGKAPFLEDALASLEARRVEVSRPLTALEEEFERLSGSPNASASDKERLMELEFELGERREELEAIEAEIAGHAGRAEATVEVTVVRCIHPRVTFVMDGRASMTHEEIRGPVTFRRGSGGELVVVRSGGLVCPIGDVFGKAA